MRILITNDDGISAPGLQVAEAIAAELAGPGGEVWTIAPVFEQSGVSHAISYVRPMRIEKVGERRWTVEGSPADCVLAGIFEVLKDARPDLILSGVNRGHNVAEDTVYSGTVGGAMEGAIQGVRSIALSQYYGRATASSDGFDAARAFGASVCRQLLEHGSWPMEPFATFYNVNFPAVPAEDVKGVRATFQGLRSASFGVQPQVAPNGRTYLWLTHMRGNADTLPGSDSRECHDGYVTVTPLRADLTAHDLVEDLGRAISTDFPARPDRASGRRA
ncbi:MAG TPA: 5'/3'-nucleotidase SurE [Paracoccaceae bacterium]|nr:5'/3'-nucleotidase SurE [Paracoccaceae bacterium]